MAGSPAVEADSSLVTTTKEPTPEASVVTFNDDGGESRTRGARRQGFALRRIQSIDSCSMGGKGRRTTTPLAGESVSSSGSTCAEPNHEELLMSVGSVLHRRIQDNEMCANKRELPLFMEDTHTRSARPDTYEVSHPLLLSRTMSMPTIFGVRKLPKPAESPLTFHVPTLHTIVQFLQNIWRRARLTPHCVIICLVYVDRLEAKSEDGVLLHARSWRPIIFSALLLASKVWHDISYWNSDFSTICPMFTIRNVNKLERTILELLSYDTIISSSQYAQYYFSLRQASFSQKGSKDMTGEQDSTPSRPTENFRTKLMMRVGVPGSNKLHTRSIAVKQEMAPRLKKMQLDMRADEEEAGQACVQSVSLLAKSAPHSQEPVANMTAATAMTAGVQPQDPR